MNESIDQSMHLLTLNHIHLWESMFTIL